MKQVGLGQGSAKTDHEAAQEGGIAPILQYVERLMSMIVAKWFGRPDLEFAFVDNREFDPKTAAEIDDIALKNLSRTINEVRDRRGDKPVPWGDKPLVETNGGLAPIDVAIERGSAEPEPVPAALSGGQPGARESETPPAEPEQGASDDAEDDLAKAADPAVTAQLAVALGSYLAGKADAIADQLANVLRKAMGEEPEKIERALDDLDWSWSDLPAVIEPFLAGIVAAAGEGALSQLGLFDADMLERVRPPSRRSLPMPRRWVTTCSSATPTCPSPRRARTPWH
ncbi:hypothetical protein H7F53_06330 [Novosphingobium piscinae]|uniref:Uncharacterized protein n=2 Tax=Novosphingobium piscinae TaxID=1507448 RepID=A0A7X1FXB9_9SPHN|nr:hypothetical protein [Novosphingobium piscinae]MBC2668751.1 hypothetical protein [Novosphingobium piscinae]